MESERESSFSEIEDMSEKSFGDFFDNDRNGNCKTSTSNRKIKIKGEPATADDIKILGLEPSDINRIYRCDKHGDLIMFHYVEGYDQVSFTDFNETESKYKTDDLKVMKQSWGEIADEEAKRFEKMKSRISKVRGWIINTKTNKIICKSFTETSIVHIAPDDIEKYINDGFILKPFIEGTNIRVFRYGDVWLHSTNKKINCINSRIPVCEANIYQMFKEALGDFNYDQLNPHFIYIFHLMHMHNQIMNQEIVDTPKVYHVASIFSQTTPYPMKIAEFEVDKVNHRSTSPDISEYSSNEKLKGVCYLENLDIDEAQGLLQMRQCVLARRGYEIIQLASPIMERFMKIRGYSNTPFNPIELLYLRLPVQDRPFLVDVMPPHQKQMASPSRMEEYVKVNSERLANFCAEVLITFLSGNKPRVTKCLYWLIKQIRLENIHVSKEFIKDEFRKLIDNLARNSGESLYRCFKDLERGAINDTNAVGNVIKHHPDEFFPYETVLKPEDFPTLENNKREDLRKTPPERPNKNNRKNDRKTPSPVPRPSKTPKSRSPNPHTKSTTVSMVDVFFDRIQR